MRKLRSIALRNFSTQNPANDIENLELSAGLLLFSGPDRGIKKVFQFTTCPSLLLTPDSILLSGWLPKYIFGQENPCYHCPSTASERPVFLEWPLWSLPRSRSVHTNEALRGEGRGPGSKLGLLEWGLWSLRLWGGKEGQVCISAMATWIDGSCQAFLKS